jgi:hypothetical protein
MVIVLVLCFLDSTYVGNVREANASSDFVYVDPAIVQTQVGATFSVSIMISGTRELWAWQAGLQWDPAVLYYVSYSWGQFGAKAQEGGGQYLRNPPVVNNLTGVFTKPAMECDVGNTSIPITVGSIQLLTVTFRVKDFGTSQLRLVNATLRGRQLGSMVSYPRWSDVNADNMVNVMDVYLISSFYSNDTYKQSLDLNDDGVIDLTDVAIVCGDFGKLWPCSQWGITDRIWVQGSFQDGEAIVEGPPNAFLGGMPALHVAHSVGEQFTLQIKVVNALFLAEFEFKLKFTSYSDNSLYLTCVDVSNGGFFPLSGMSNFTATVNNTEGIVYARGELSGWCPSVNGSGTLLAITFEATRATYFPNSSLSILEIYDAHLYSRVRSGYPKHPVPLDPPVDSMYIAPMIMPPPAPDIGVTNVVTSYTSIWKGKPIIINVTVENHGSFVTSFNVTAYVNDTTIGIQFAGLAIGESATFSFLWNTTEFAYGNYSVWAYTVPVANETHVVDNNFTASIVHLGIVGNVNGDSKVDLKDVFAVGKAYGSVIGDARYIANCDINGDGKIDLKDYFATTKNYGKVEP